MPEQVTKIEFQIEGLTHAVNQLTTAVHEQATGMIALTNLLIEKGIFTDEEMCAAVDATKQIIAENLSDG